MKPKPKSDTFVIMYFEKQWKERPEWCKAFVRSEWNDKFGFKRFTETITEDGDGVWILIEK